MGSLRVVCSSSASARAFAALIDLQVLVPISLPASFPCHRQDLMSEASSVPDGGVLAWFATTFPSLPQPSPDLSDEDATRLWKAVAARRHEYAQELWQLEMVEAHLERLLTNATGRALSAAFAVPFQPVDLPPVSVAGESPRVPGSANGSALFSPRSPSALGGGSTSGVGLRRRLSLVSSAPSTPGSGTVGAPLTPGRGGQGAGGKGFGGAARRSSGASSGTAPRSRSRLLLPSSSQPPDGFVATDHETWPTTCPTDWCRACYPQVRDKRFSCPHDYGELGRRCRLAIAPEDRLPATLFGFAWAPVKPFLSGQGVTAAGLPPVGPVQGALPGPASLTGPGSAVGGGVSAEGSNSGGGVEATATKLSAAAGVAPEATAAVLLNSGNFYSGTVAQPAGSPSDVPTLAQEVAPSTPLSSVPMASTGAGSGAGDSAALHAVNSHSASGLGSGRSVDSCAGNDGAGDSSAALSAGQPSSLPVPNLGSMTF